MGIQKRLVGSYFVVICLTVLILEIILNISVRYYYFHNIEQTLMNQAELSASFYQQYFGEEDLEEQSERLLKGLPVIPMHRYRLLMLKVGCCRIRMESKAILP